MSRQRSPVFEAALFDMDGTLVRSCYDWPMIRSTLGVDGPSIIDALNELPEPRRSAAWQTLIRIERRASVEATLIDGAAELVELVQDRGLHTALVTNNTDENTHALLERFGLSFTLVLTRDSGYYKPSGAPIAEAMRRLGVSPELCLAVGDSGYDVMAAREAGCAQVVVVNGGYDAHGRDADLAFRGLDELTNHLGRIL